MVWFLFYKVYLRETECTSRGGPQREGERIPSRFRTDSTELNAGLELMNREIMT